MSTINIFGIIFVLLIMLAGAYLWFDDYQRQKRRRNIALSDDLQDKNGIPVIPRHLRKFARKNGSQPNTSETANPTSNQIPLNTQSVAITSNSPQVTNSTPTNHNDYGNEGHDNDSEHNSATSQSDASSASNAVTEKPTITASQTFAQTEFQSGVETKTISQLQSRHKYQMASTDIEQNGQPNEESTEPKSVDDLIGNADVQFDTDIEFQTDDFDTDIEFDTRLHGELQNEPKQSDLPAEEQKPLEEDASDFDNSRHKIHYTAGNYQSIESETTEYSQTSEYQNADYQKSMYQQDSYSDTVNNEEDAFSNLASATQSLSTGYEQTEYQGSDTQSLLSTDGNRTENSPTMGNEGLDNRQIMDNSPFLDQHLQMSDETDQDPNSPLTNARDNLNISILPFNEFSHISGAKVLSMVDDFGFKFGTMNMFHRYQNKDGSGVLWFSMMGLTNEGIVPFDLNALPTSINLKGLVMFLPLPHPKVLQGFDSMMSIAGLIAREVNGYIVDEDGNEIDADYKKKLRALLQSHLVDDV